MPALVATRFNPDMNAKYKALVAAGKLPKVAITAVIRKLVVLVNALLKAERKWTLKLASLQRILKIELVHLTAIETFEVASAASTVHDHRLQTVAAFCTGLSRLRSWLTPSCSSPIHLLCYIAHGHEIWNDDQKRVNISCRPM